MADCEANNKSIKCPYGGCQQNIEVKCLVEHLLLGHNINLNIGNQHKLNLNSGPYILLKVCKQMYFIQYAKLQGRDRSRIKIGIYIIRDCCEKKKTCSLKIYDSNSNVYRNINLKIFQYCNDNKFFDDEIVITFQEDCNTVVFEECCIDENTLTDCINNFTECIICYERLTFPINQCSGGHIIGNCCINKLTTCPVCRISLTGSRVRNLFAENAMEYLTVTCKYEHCGFTDKLPKMCIHEEECVYKYIRCPFDCEWKNSPCEVMQHIKQVHAENVLSIQENHIFVDESTISNTPTTKLDIFVIEKFDIPFVIFQAITGNEFYFMVKAIVLDESDKFYFQLKFSSDSECDYFNFRAACNKYKKPYNKDLNKVFTKEKSYLKMSLISLKPFMDDIRLPYKISITKLGNEDKEKSAE